jgi:site-specific DNA recombinase
MTMYFAYIRVSTKKQGVTGVSLQEQRAAIINFATKEGLKINIWFEERQTAASRGGPVFQEMLTPLGARHAQGVIILKVDRGARNLRDWADIGELIDADVDVRLAGEPVDLRSRGGRLSADIQAVIASDYIRNLREKTRLGFYGRIKQGLLPLPAPLGYQDNGGGKVKTIHPVWGFLVRQLFECYATGDYTILIVIIRFFPQDMDPVDDEQRPHQALLMSGCRTRGVAALPTGAPRA